MGTSTEQGGRGQARAGGGRAGGAKDGNRDKRPHSGQPKGVGRGVDEAWGHGRGQLISSVLTLWCVYVCCECVCFKTNNTWKENNKEVLEQCGPRTHLTAHATLTHIHTSWPYTLHTCHAHSRIQSSPLEPGSFQLYIPDPCGSCLLLSRSLLVLSPPATGTLACRGPPESHLPDVASIVGLARLAFFLLSLLACFLRLLLLLVLPADTTPKVP